MIHLVNAGNPMVAISPLTQHHGHANELPGPAQRSHCSGSDHGLYGIVTVSLKFSAQGLYLRLITETWSLEISVLPDRQFLSECFSNSVYGGSWSSRSFGMSPKMSKSRQQDLCYNLENASLV